MTRSEAAQDVMRGSHRPIGRGDGVLSSSAIPVGGRSGGCASEGYVPAVQQRQPINVIAHRGANRHAPENTLEAFRTAVTLGSDGIELDVRSTADGALVIHHDAHLPDGRAIADTVRAELPSSVPDLHAALDACSPVLVNIEIKNSDGEPGFDERREIADRVVNELRGRSETFDRWLISSFDRATVDRVRDLGGPRTALLTEAPAAEALERLLAAGEPAHPVWHPWFGDLDAPTLARARAAGVEVNVWTVDGADAIESMIELGVDGICTDEPDVARSLLRRSD